ncbi:nucleotidyl transferase AbiEii/AbiGii toxin family protein [Candidatus Amesbacteria bacterium]|nr:nucleotidyl transferase AbiEii/AbiGii toxin family protein [Candidatus Amesbacteria bacterium]
MIDFSDLLQLSKSLRVSEFVILREYLQILFLNYFYSLPNSHNIVFKGGTALRLMHLSNRYSEDLDFTISIKNKDLEKMVFVTIKKMSDQIIEPITVKTLLTPVGFSQRLSVQTSHSKIPLTIKLDFSQRERVIFPVQSTITTTLPVALFSPITYMDTKEILAEKFRAITNRHKGRDIYDIWYLLRRNTLIDPVLIQKKLDYYQEKYDPKKIVEIIQKWNTKDFDQDVRGFLPEKDRNIIPIVISNLLEDLNPRLEKIITSNIG